jgi:hypothetical protein
MVLGRAGPQLEHPRPQGPPAIHELLQVRRQVHQGDCSDPDGKERTAVSPLRWSGSPPPAARRPPRGRQARNRWRRVAWARDDPRDCKCGPTRELSLQMSYRRKIYGP